MKLDPLSILGVALIAVGVFLGAHMILHEAVHSNIIWYFTGGLVVLGAFFVDPAKAGQLISSLVPWKKS